MWLLTFWDGGCKIWWQDVQLEHGFFVRKNFIAFEFDGTRVEGNCLFGKACLIFHELLNLH